MTLLMTQWTGKTRGKFREILIRKFLNQEQIRIWLDQECEISQIQLAEIGGDTYAGWVYSLLSKANAEGWINKIFVRFCYTNEDRNKISQLIEIVQELGDRELDKEVNKILNNYPSEKKTSESRDMIESHQERKYRAVILTALPVEFKAVKSFLTEIVEKIHPETKNIYKLGKFNAGGKVWEVGLAEIGAGKAVAAGETERAIAFFKPQVILFVGIAGGIKDVRIGDVVAGTKVYGYESGKAEQEKFKPRPELGQGSYDLVERAKEERREENWLQRIPNAQEPQPEAFIGAIAAGEKVVASTQSDVCQFLKNNYSDALAVEMEGYGFLKAAYANQTRVSALVIRGISDLIDHKNDTIEQEPEKIRQQKASLHASAFAFEILAKFDPLSGFTGSQPPPQQEIKPTWDIPSPKPENGHPGYLLIALDPIDDENNVAFTAELHQPNSVPKTDLLPLPLEDIEYEVAEFIHFPPLQPCIYEAAFISAILERFEFETATIEQKSRFLGFDRRWLITRSQGANWGYTESLSQDIGLEMVAIPEGSFLMGSPKGEPESDNSERPQHEVRLQPFYLGRYPITQAQWRIVAGYERVARELDLEPSRFKRDNRPVENIRWQDAEEFCRRLSAKTGKDYRLPSEAQWEYTCRAGTTTPFHFGKIITTDLANYNGNYSYNDSPKGKYREQTTEVGSFLANAWGLCDMHGNVWEWCADDWHGDYTGAPSDGSAWLENDKSDQNKADKLLRGGSWN